MAAAIRTRRATVLALALALIGTAASTLTCASAPPVASCPARADQNPAPAPACLAQAESRRFLLDAGHRLGDALMSWRSQPGAVTLAVSFAGDASVDSVCLRDREGVVMADRVRRAAARLARRDAPACFANRRIEFAWQSPDVTGYQIAQAKRECDADADAPRDIIDACYWMQSCQVEEVERLWREADDRVAECVLQRVPISIVADDTPAVALFLPADGTTPDARNALDALAECDGRASQEEGVACMARLGWRRIE